MKEPKLELQHPGSGGQLAELPSMTRMATKPEEHTYEGDCPAVGGRHACLRGDYCIRTFKCLTYRRILQSRHTKRCLSRFSDLDTITSFNIACNHYSLYFNYTVFMI